MTELRKNLPLLPERMRGLPVDPRGYPIPFFVGTFEGKRDFRIADQQKRVQCVKRSLCWLCGQPLGRYKAFVIGPMCAVNHNTSEPPSHRDCALFAVQACPFLMLPKSDYRAPPAGGKQLPGAIVGNPGACCIWITERFKPYRVADSWLIRIGDPVEVLWYAEGKPATRAQIMDSFERRLPLLRQIAQEHGEEAELDKQVERTMTLLPA